MCIQIEVGMFTKETIAAVGSKEVMDSGTILPGVVQAREVVQAICIGIINPEARETKERIRTAIEEEHQDQGGVVVVDVEGRTNFNEKMRQ